MKTEGKTIEIIVKTERAHTEHEWLDEYRGVIEGKRCKIDYAIRFREPYLQIIEDEKRFLESTELEVRVNGNEVADPSDISSFKKLVVELIYEHIAYFESAFGEGGSSFNLSREAQQYLPEEFKKGAALDEEDVKRFILSARTPAGRDKLMQYVAEARPGLESEYRVTISGDVKKVLEKYAAPPDNNL